MMKISVFIASCLLVTGMAAYSQSVGIGTNAPDNSALLHLNSSSKGFLLPSMATSQRTAIAAPAEGLLLHDFNTKSIWFRTSATWTEIVTTSNNLWQENGSDIYRTTGNVGIGITNAINRLHVHNSLGNTNFLRVTNNGSGALATDGLILGALNANASLINKENGYLVLGSNDDSVVFMTSVFGGVPRMGINESLPTATLDVKSTANNVAKFNGANQMYLSLYENGFGRGYIGSVSGNSSDVDFGTTGDDPNARLHLAINMNPRLTISEKGNVGIGTTTPASNTRLQVTGDSANTAVFSSNYSGVNPSSVITTNMIGTLDYFSTGISVYQDAIQGRGRGLYVRGGYIGAEVYSVNSNFANQNYGIISTATCDNDAWGLYGIANGSGIVGDRVGVFGMASGGATRWAFYGQGNAFLSGGTWQTSDERFKKNIQPSGNASGKLARLVPSEYSFDTASYSFMQLPTEHQHGFLAANVQEVFPELVKKVKAYKTRPAPGQTSESIEFNAVNYIGLIPVLTQAINEHTEEISKMKAMLEEYKSLVNEQQKIIEQLKNQK